MVLFFRKCSVPRTQAMWLDLEAVQVSFYYTQVIDVKDDNDMNEDEKMSGYRAKYQEAFFAYFLKWEHSGRFFFLL